MHEVDAARVRDFAEVNGFARIRDAAGAAPVQYHDCSDRGGERRDHNETTPRNHGLNDIRLGKGALVSLSMFRPSGCSIGMLLLAVASCGRESAPQRFTLLSPAQTGVTFANTITTNDSFNIQKDVYIYNGAGVAAGDIDNDGLPDLFFSGNMVSSRLYRNKGNMQFEDITDRAGVTTNRWCTGATMGDINEDGYLDIYVSVSAPGGGGKGADRANLLFINNGNGTFTEAARAYGIADTAYTTHAVFLDYNHDGFLDLFLLNNSPRDFARGAADEHPLGLRSQSSEGWNTLYRNNGDGSLTDVSQL